MGITKGKNIRKLNNSAKGNKISFLSMVWDGLGNEHKIRSNLGGGNFTDLGSGPFSIISMGFCPTSIESAEGAV